MRISNQMVELVARRMCEYLDVDPDAVVKADRRNTLTPNERLTDFAAPIPGYECPRWRLYRYEAAKAIASRWALIDLADEMRKTGHLAWNVE